MIPVASTFSERSPISPESPRSISISSKWDSPSEPVYRRVIVIILHSHLGQSAFDHLTLGLQPGRKNQFLTQLVSVLIDIVPRTICCDLKENTSWRTEIDRVEPVAVDIWRRVQTHLAHTLSQRLQFIIICNSESDVMDRSAATGGESRISDLDDHTASDGSSRRVEP